MLLRLLKRVGVGSVGLEQTTCTVKAVCFQYFFSVKTRFNI